MHGNSATSAIGRPSLESWDLFTRETLQNSWDARDRSSSEDGVTFSIDYRRLTGHRSEALRNFFGTGTEGLPALAGFLAEPRETPLPVLLVSDTGTSGLQGPTSAAQHCAGRDDFVSFVRNIGRRAEKELRGGTYGFGKGVFFNISDSQTVLIYTRTRDENGAPARRFIAMANGNGYTKNSYEYTGRHWWGVKELGVQENVYANPFTGPEADALARTFQMDSHFTEERPTGTTVAVVNPRIDPDEVDTVMETISNALTKWAWPHMVSRSGDMDPIDFSVTVDGREIPIPDPLKDPLLRPFVRAYRLAIKEPEHLDPNSFVTEFQKSGPRKWMDIVSGNPVEYLGRLAVQSTPAENNPQPSVLDDGMNHHVALMRGPRMIVNYWQGPRASAEDCYAGIFQAAEHLDSLFAASEPPAHDEWNPTTVNLKDARFHRNGKPRRSNPVRIAMNRLRDSLKNETSSKVENDSTGDASALSTISSSLGSVMPSAAGSSRRITRPQPGRLTRQKPVKSHHGVRSSISLASLHATSRGTLALFKVGVDSSPKALENEVRVEVESAVLVDGKRQLEAKDGLVMPTPLGWVAPHELEKSLEGIVGRNASDQDLHRIMRSPSWESYYAVIQPINSAISADVVVTVQAEGDDQ
ncbi:hypothetical protein EAH68_01315 [Corynebacterium hylobatis]|uniref:Uncharacterized protein n=1 Tax=Corynebacterium hylobatis TaxID=1859290 RepID=A0A3S0BJ52_9CORY|nr:hypothetical protein [Corynebacterium hylobatis]RSZ65429.1 hypothetical protein EAH68_01315 [Corynebacterium hylobatis]